MTLVARFRRSIGFQACEEPIRELMMTAPTQRQKLRTECRLASEARPLLGQQAVDLYFGKISENAQLLRLQIAKLETALALHKCMLAERGAA